MRIARTYSQIDPSLRGASAAIGNFDGVHLGHQGVIEIARQSGKRIGAPLGVVTFEPHPREYFAPDAPPFRLTSDRSRANRLARLGVETLFCLPFDGSLAGLEATEFARDVLAQGMGLRHVVVGQDFRFGKGRSGDAQALTEFGREFGFGVTLAELLTTDGTGKPISSTRIREALSAGQTRQAREMLGHWHRIEGLVLHGAKRGRELNYPTANMDIAGLHQPRYGVYAVLVDILDGPDTGSYHGVASLGVRPMFGVNAPNLETHIFDFSGDLYGHQMSVALVEFLRPEHRFDSVETLVEQMNADAALARRILSEDVS